MFYMLFCALIFPICFSTIFRSDFRCRGVVPSAGALTAKAYEVDVGGGWKQGVGSWEVESAGERLRLGIDSWR